MSPTSVDAFDRAQQTAHVWLADVVRALGTDDRRFAYRALRAWLHTLRDRLTVDSAVTLGAQLPELLRGVYYDGWQPRRAPITYGPDEYLERFACEAGIATTDVRSAAASVAKAMARRFRPGHLAETLAQLPAPLRALIGGAGEGPATDATAVAGPSPDESEPSAEEQLRALEARIDVLTEAVRALATGFEPGRRIDEQRRARAARLAAEILMTDERPVANAARR